VAHPDLRLVVQLPTPASAEVSEENYDRIARTLDRLYGV